MVSTALVSFKDESILSIRSSGTWLDSPARFVLLIVMSCISLADPKRVRELSAVQILYYRPNNQITALTGRESTSTSARSRDRSSPGTMRYFCAYMDNASRHRTNWSRYPRITISDRMFVNRSLWPAMAAFQPWFALASQPFATVMLGLQPYLSRSAVAGIASANQDSLDCANVNSPKMERGPSRFLDCWSQCSSLK